MAEILIRKRPHWAETEKPADWSEAKWAGRPLRGDIVEVQPNGYFHIQSLGTGTHGWNRDAFALIKLTNLSYTVASLYFSSYISEAIQLKSRYRIEAWQTIPWIKNTVYINGKPYEEWYFVRENLTGINIRDKSH